MRHEYNTRQKRELLHFLEERNMQHFSVDEVVFALEKDGDRIGRSTVYRYLELLAEQGNVRKYQNAQGITQYQHVENVDSCDDHFHMMCQKCGNLMHVDCDYMKTIAEHFMRDHDFQLDPRETILVGICAKCRGESEEDNNGADRSGTCNHSF